MKDKRTKIELIEEYTEKVKKASPMVKKITLSGLRWQTKKELRRLIKTVKVLPNGDITYAR